MDFRGISAVGGHEAKSTLYSGAVFTSVSNLKKWNEADFCREKLAKVRCGWRSQPFDEGFRGVEIDKRSRSTRCLSSHVRAQLRHRLRNWAITLQMQCAHQGYLAHQVQSISTGFNTLYNDVLYRRCPLVFNSQDECSSRRGGYIITVDFSPSRRARNR